MYQMTIFDLIPEEKKFPSLIEKFAKEIKEILGFPSNESYRVWDHVPTLGKRYEAWFYDVNLTEEINEKIEIIQNEFKNTVLDVSFIQIPSMKSNELQRIMVSTMWKTKAHREVV